jgi:hypothetical protein
MAIPRIQLNMVDLVNLQPGVRYTFTQMNRPGYIYEGTFNQVIPPSPANNGHAQYFFSNVSRYTQQGRLIEQSRSTNFANPDSYPSDIFVYDLPKLPNELNQYIRSFGGKSRKSKSRNNRKTKKRRNNRKSKRRP